MSERALADVMKCSAVFEKEVADLYLTLAERVRFDDVIPLVLRHIARESSNHAELLRHMSLVLNLSSDIDCLEFLENRLKPVIALRNEVMRLKEVSPQYLSRVLTKLRDVEGLANEEIYSRTIYPLMASLISNDVINTLLSEVATEEEFRERLIKKLSEYLTKILEGKVGKSLRG